MAKKIAEKQWRLIQNDPCNGATNMAIDEALLLSVVSGKASPTIHLYGWSPPALSLGHLQHARTEVDVKRCRSLGIDIVRRPTGGRAVLHDCELTYSVTAPEGLFPAPSSILSVYREISNALVAGLAHLGIEAKMVPELRDLSQRGPKINPPACFAVPSAYEVTVGGRKIIGSAQKRFKGCVLQQGSILLSLDPRLLFSLFLPGQSRNLEDKMTSIREVLGKGVSFAEAVVSMREGFRKAWGVTLEKEKLDEAERKMVKKLKREKYDVEEWNLRR